MKVVKITSDGDEITRYGFMSHMEHYLKQLLSDPLKASVGDYLMSHGIDNEGILPMLLHNPDKSDENNAILIRTERIKTDPKTGKDKFCVKYKMPRKNFDKKMRNLFINLFENYKTDNDMLNEDGAGGTMAGMGGATNASSSGQFVQPLFGKPITRKFNITEDQLEYLKKALAEEAVVNSMVGDFGYDAPASVCKKDDPTMQRHNGVGGSISVNIV